MTSIEVAAWILSSVLLKGTVLALGVVVGARLGLGSGAWGVGVLLAGALALLTLVLPDLGAGFVSVPHDAIKNVAMGSLTVSPVGAFVAFWAGGVLVMLVRFSGDVAAARSLVRTGRAPAARTIEVLRRAADAVRYRHVPDLRETNVLATAALVGVRRPVLLLPAQAREWSDEELFGVLCHELEHARRHDFVMLMVGRVVQSIFWINPLVHVMTRQAAAVREMVADEAALRAGTTATVYAGRLIAVARELRASPGMAGSVAFVSGGVDERVRALFDNEGRRPSVSTWRVAIAVTPLVLVLAAFQPWTCLP